MLGSARSRLVAGGVAAVAAGAVAVALATVGSNTDSGTTSVPREATGGEATSVPREAAGGKAASVPRKAAGGKTAKAVKRSAPPSPRAAHPRPPRPHQGPPGGPLRGTYPAHILGHELAEGGLVEPAELWPVRNGWEVSDHRMLTAVYAGADPLHRSTGRLVIFRQDFIQVTQKSDMVNVVGTGPLKITSAPRGTEVETSAQRRGTLTFVARDGTRGTLHLKDDTVTLR